MLAAAARKGETASTLEHWACCRVLMQVERWGASCAARSQIARYTGMQAGGKQAGADGGGTYAAQFRGCTSGHLNAECRSRSFVATALRCASLWEWRRAHRRPACTAPAACCPWQRRQQRQCPAGTRRCCRCCCSPRRSELLLLLLRNVAAFVAAQHLQSAAACATRTLCSPQDSVR